eukprot:Opistho-2@31452
MQEALIYYVSKNALSTSECMEIRIWGCLVHESKFNLICLRPEIVVRKDDIVITGLLYENIDEIADIATVKGIATLAKWLAVVRETGTLLKRLSGSGKVVPPPEGFVLPDSKMSSQSNFKNVNDIKSLENIFRTKLDVKDKRGGGAADGPVEGDDEPESVPERIGVVDSRLLAEAACETMGATIQELCFDGTSTWVWMARVKTDENVAVIVKTGRHDSREVALLRHFGSYDNIPALLYAHEVSDGTYCIVEPWLFAEDPPSPLTTAATALLLLRDCSRALAVLHSVGIVHRDVKPSAVRFGWDTLCWRLVDYDLVDALDEAGTAPPAGTKGFIAPECLGAAGRASAAGDMWALGRTVDFLYSQHFAGNIATASPFQWSVVRGIVQRLMRVHPEERPTAASLADELTLMFRTANCDLGGTKFPMTVELRKTSMEREQLGICMTLARQSVW